MDAEFKITYFDYRTGKETTTKWLTFKEFCELLQGLERDSNSVILGAEIITEHSPKSIKL